MPVRSAWETKIGEYDAMAKLTMYIHIRGLTKFKQVSSTLTLTLTLSKADEDIWNMVFSTQTITNV